MGLILGGEYIKSVELVFRGFKGKGAYVWDFTGRVLFFFFWSNFLPRPPESSLFQAFRSWGQCKEM